MKNLFKVDEHFECPFFIGTVEDNVDPTFNYRVKVRIDHLHPESIVTENLPWAARVDTAFMGVGDDQALNHAIPEVGTQVLLLPVGHNINSLVYLGSLYKKTVQTPQNESYTDSFGVYMRNGQFIGIEKIKKLFQMLFDGDLNIDKVINANINVKNTIDTKCTTVNLKASDIYTTSNTIKTTVNDETFDVNNQLAINTGVQLKIKSNASIEMSSPVTNINGNLTVSTGASGLFVAGGKTVTVSKGIVTNIS